MVNHLKNLLSLGSIEASLLFHPITPSNGINRKILTQTSRKQVIEGINLIKEKINLK